MPTMLLNKSALLVIIASLGGASARMGMSRSRNLGEGGTCYWSWQCNTHGFYPSWWSWHCECEPDWKGNCCGDSMYELHRIANDDVVNEVAFAKTGSAIPSALHGIFWMDQRGVAVAENIWPTDPSYRQVGGTAADEILVAFGDDDLDWDPKTKCANVPVFGGPKGHWTFFDTTGNGESDTHRGAMGILLTGRFCFTNDDFTELDVNLRVKAGNVLELVTGSDFLPQIFDNYVEVPHNIIHLTMVKTEWGWDRVTTIGPEFLRSSKKLQDFWRSHLPSELAGMLDAAADTFHYPVFQVIDGDGQETEHYEAYLKWANEQTDPSYEGGSDFEHVLNRGKGTQLVGKLI